MKLLLEDFSFKPQQTGKENLEEAYIIQIQQLRQQIEELKNTLNAEKEAAYKKGLEDGTARGYDLAKQEFEARLQQVEEEKTSQLKQSLKDYLVKLDDNINRLQTNYKEIILQTAEIISDSITEIFDFLYLSEENKDLVVRQIRELLEEFFEYPKVYIKVGNPQLMEIFKLRGFDVEIDQNLKGLDFVVDFREFRVENRIAEKLEIIKDEIKREIKKLSEV